MKNLLSVLVIISIFSCDPVPSCESCSFTCLEDITDDVITNKCPQNHDCTFLLEEDKMLAQDSVGTLLDNTDFLVFSIYTYTEGSKLIADDEFTTQIYIDVEQNSTSFSYENDAISEHATAQRICFCPNTHFRTSDKGCVQGEKVDGTWYVQGKIMIEDGPTYEFDLSF